MKLNIESQQFTSTRFVTFNLQECPHLVKFGQAGMLTPIAGSIKKIEDSRGGNDTYIVLYAYNDHNIRFRGEWGSRYATKLYNSDHGYGGCGLTSDLPHQIVTAALDALEALEA